MTERYQEHLFDALECLKGWQLAQAQLVLRQAIGRDPSRPEAFNLLGVVAELGGDHNQADRFFRAALALDPRTEAARRNLDRERTTDDLCLGAAARIAAGPPETDERPCRARRTSQLDPGHGPSPYRSPALDGRASTRSWSGLRAFGASLLFVVAAAIGIGLWMWIQGSEARAVSALPVGERTDLYRRTLSNLRFCRDHPREDAFKEFCQRQAELGMAFPECAAECRSLARLAWPGATR